MKNKKMRLEHKKQKVVSFHEFLIRLGSYAFVAGMLIVFSVCIGMSGYHYFGRLSWLESFHMSCMILTGMGPVAEMRTDGAKIFSSIFALYSGVAFLSITAVFFAPIVHRLLHILHVEVNEDEELPRSEKNQNTRKRV
jgi:hypothetical protein